MDKKWWPEEWDNQYPEKDFTRQFYSFSAEEMRTLASFSNMALMAALLANVANTAAKNAEGMASKYVMDEAVKRLGLKLTSDAGINFEPNIGKLVVASPKVVCQKCNDKKAEYSYKNKALCEACSKIETESDKKPVKKKA